jgi:catechol 2,3-dioxygenase-like lactoylglutathione lyase family enzyme
VKFSRVVIKTKDYRRSFAFYKDTLGLRLSTSWQRKDSWGAVFSAGDATVEIIWYPSGEGFDDCNYPMERAKVDINFEVSDIDILHNRLADAGVKIVNEPHDVAWGFRLFTIKDPDDIRISFLQPMH